MLDTMASAICDTCAATGNYAKLDQLSSRWEDRARRYNWGKMAAIAYSISNIFMYRATAIRFRLHGSIAQALRYEGYAEKMDTDLHLFRRDFSFYSIKE